MEVKLRRAERERDLTRRVLERATGAGLAVGEEVEDVPLRGSPVAPHDGGRRAAIPSSSALKAANELGRSNFDANASCELEGGEGEKNLNNYESKIAESMKLLSFGNVLLPERAMSRILSFCPPIPYLLYMAQTCRSLRRLAAAANLWREVDFGHYRTLSDDSVTRWDSTPANYILFSAFYQICRILNQAAHLIPLSGATRELSLNGNFKWACALKECSFSNAAIRQIDRREYIPTNKTVPTSRFARFDWCLSPHGERCKPYC